MTSLIRGPCLRYTHLSTLMCGLLLVTPTHADWRVTDNTTQNKISETNSRLDTTNSHLNDVKTKLDTTNNWLDRQYQQQQIGSATKSADKGPDGPGVSLAKDNLSAIGNGKQTRCPGAGGSTNAANQQTICNEIVDTEVAQYNYALAMRQIALDRQGRLDTLESERASLNTQSDAGKLQTNSNELLALLARMEADRQQYRTYMDAYETRLHYLHSLQDALGNMAVNGSNGGGTGSMAGQIIGSAAALVALQTALQLQKTQKNNSSYE